MVARLNRPGTCLAGLTMIDTLKPNPLLLMKLVSIAVHAEELLSPGGHLFDRAALEALLNDPDVKQWIKDMGAYLPSSARS